MSFGRKKEGEFQTHWMTHSHPMEKYKIMNKDNFNFFIALTIFIAIVGCGICQKSDTSKDKERVPQIIVNAETLIKDYRENEVAADKEYKNKILEVDGVVFQVKKEGIRIIVILQESKSYWGVKCQFNKEYEVDAEDLRKGDKIRIIGRCMGMRDNFPYLSNCRVK